MLSYIPDGYDELGYIRPVPRIHLGLRFRFRPLLVEERSRLVEAAGKMRGDAYDRKCAAELAGKLLEWDLRDGADEAVPLTPANLLRLKPQLFQRLFAIVLGSEAGDLDSHGDEHQEQRIVEHQFAAALSDRPIGEVREEDDEGN